jgi:hypothetical protein
LLKFLAQATPCPWLVVGDLNEITCLSEKSSRSVRLRALMDNFRDTLGECHLADLGFKGQLFTWTNGWPRVGNTLDRLDHAVANAEWSSWYNVVEVSILPWCVSDHNPLFITYSNSLELRWTTRCQFWFEAAWEKDSTSKEIIKKEWRVKAPIGDSCGPSAKEVGSIQKVPPNLGS